MEIEIKLKCSICETWLNGGQRLETPDTLIFVQPCPTCHPAKPEKVTPKAGEWIDGRNHNMAITAFNRRIADGTRHKTGVRAKDDNCYKGVPYDQWRYPGETEWRD